MVVMIMVPATFIITTLITTNIESDLNRKSYAPKALNPTTRKLDIVLPRVNVTPIITALTQNHNPQVASA